jgi:putative oxidoreductase
MDFGILLLRAVVGITLAAHGAQKLFGWFGGHGLDGTGKFMTMLGFQPGRRHALMAGLAEGVGGILLALGFLTPVGAALGASVMLVAAVTTHATNGFFNSSGGFEYNLVLGIGALSIAFIGPGAASIDALLGYSPSGAVWGSAAALLAAIGTAGQLAQRRFPETLEAAA